MNKKLLSLLLALIMLIGSVSPAFAQTTLGQVETPSPEQQLYVEKNGKLKIPLKLNTQPRIATRSTYATRSTEPGFGETKIVLTITKTGLNGDFPFSDIFGNSTTATLEYYDPETGEARDVETVTFGPADTEVEFQTILDMQEVIDGNYSVYFSGENVAGKITSIEETQDPQLGNNVTNASIEIIQLRNADVIIKTVTEEDPNTAIANPTTAATTGKIILTSTDGKVAVEEDLWSGNDPKIMVDEEEFEVSINPGFNVEVKGLDNGVLVDTAGNHVYKPAITVDPKGIKATEVVFTQKPLVTTDDKSADRDYVKVTFDKGEHGTLDSTPVYYVFAGVNLGKRLTPPTVTADTDWEFTDWKPGLATKYTGPTIHIAQYANEPEVIVPVFDPETGNYPAYPHGYFTITFYATESDSESQIDGTFPNEQDNQPIHVKQGVTWDNQKLQNAIAALNPKDNDDENRPLAAWKAEDGSNVPNGTNEVQDNETFYAEYNAKVTFVSEDETKGTVGDNNIVYVLKSANKTLADVAAPATTPAEGYKFEKWTPALDETTAVDQDLTVEGSFAKLEEVVGPVDPGKTPNPDENQYWTVTFTTADAATGTVAAENTVYVLKSANKTLADVAAPA
ncbi:MAG: hypothetical protein Q4E76_06285, partial [Tissierellia bacterium]|nr:hypothetical protein [Tissierellia bacterium]